MGETHAYLTARMIQACGLLWLPISQRAGPVDTVVPVWHSVWYFTYYPRPRHVMRLGKEWPTSQFVGCLFDYDWIGVGLTKSQRQS